MHTETDIAHNNHSESLETQFSCILTNSTTLYGLIFSLHDY